MLPRWTYARGKPGCPGVAGMSALTLDAGGELEGPGVQDPTRGGSREVGRGQAGTPPPRWALIIKQARRAQMAALI